MPARTTGPKGPDPQRGGTPDAFDDLYKDFDFDEDPFASPEPENGAGKKRKQGEKDALGIDEAVDVKKRARVPRVKLDETRLLSDNGIPMLRKRAAGLKLKGKGHEFSDASRLLSFYQLWLDDLFPKAKFLDALGMVEKAGHKGIMHKARLDWINEGRPRHSVDAADESNAPRAAPAEPQEAEAQAASAAARIAPIFEKAQSSSDRPRTPEMDDLFTDEDLYGATPGRTGWGNDTSTTITKEQGANGGGEPEEDDLDALMAEAEAGGSSSGQGQQSGGYQSLFGYKTSANGPSQPRAANSTAEDDGDDLEALMAEAENMGQTEADKGEGKKSGGDGGTSSFDDDEAAMAEMGGMW